MIDLHEEHEEHTIVKAGCSMTLVEPGMLGREGIGSS